MAEQLSEIVVAPISKETAPKKEILSPERRGVQAALLLDGKRPEKEAMAPEELRAMRSKIEKGESLDAEKSSNASKFKSHEYWTRNEEDYDNKTSKQQDEIFENNKQVWIKKTDSVLAQLKGKPEAQIFEKLGISLDGNGASAFYEEYFAGKDKDTVGFLTGKIASRKITQEELKLAQGMVKLKTKKIEINPENNEQVEKEVEFEMSALDILGKFYSIEGSEIKDRAEGVLNFRDNYEDSERAAIEQYGKPFDEKDTKILEDIHTNHKNWENVKAEREAKVQAEKEAQRQAEEEARKQKEEEARLAKEKQMQEEAEKERAKKEGKIGTEDFRTWLAERDNFRHEDGNLVYITEALKSREFKGKEDPYQIFLEKFEYKKGDKVLYGDKNAALEGTVDEEDVGDKKRLYIIDANGQPVPLFDVLNGEEGFIKRKIEEAASAGAGEEGGVNAKINEAFREIGRILTPAEMKIITEGGDTENVLHYIKERVVEDIEGAKKSALSLEQLKDPKISHEEKSKTVVPLSSPKELEFALIEFGILGDEQQKADFALIKAQYNRAIELKMAPFFVLQVVKEGEDKFTPIYKMQIAQFPEGLTDDKKQELIDELNSVKLR